MFEGEKKLVIRVSEKDLKFIQKGMKKEKLNKSNYVRLKLGLNIVK